MLNQSEIIQAWRDQDFFMGLDDEQRTALPANPAGLIELSDESLNGIAGGSSSAPTFIDCTRPRIACSESQWC